VGGGLTFTSRLLGHGCSESVDKTMSLHFERIQEYLKDISWHRFGLIMLGFSIGIISLSTVYIAGFLFGLGIEFSALVDSEIFYRSIQELIFVLSFVIIYIRLGEVQLRATLRGAKRRGAAGRRFRKMKNLPPSISQSARMFGRYFLAPMVLLTMFTALFVLLISKFLDVRAALSWLAFNAAIGVFGVWVIARFNSRSSKNIRSVRMLWRSLNSSPGDRATYLLNVKGLVSTLSVAVLLSTFALGSGRFQTLIRAQPSCVETTTGMIFASLIMQTGSGYIFAIQLSDTRSFSNRKLHIMYLGKDAVHSISSFCTVR
jgi:hypothetical protein